MNVSFFKASTADPDWLKTISRSLEKENDSKSQIEQITFEELKVFEGYLNLEDLPFFFKHDDLILGPEDDKILLSGEPIGTFFFRSSLLEGCINFVYLNHVEEISIQRFPLVAKLGTDKPYGRVVSSEFDYSFLCKSDIEKQSGLLDIIEFCKSEFNFYKPLKKQALSKITKMEEATISKALSFSEPHPTKKISRSFPGWVEGLQKKDLLGEGISKAFFSLKKQGSEAKQLLKKIKLRNRVIPLEFIQELWNEGLKKMIHHEINVNFDSQKYPQMPLSEQTALRKEWIKLLEQFTSFSNEDILTIFKIHVLHFEKSLNNKKKKLLNLETAVSRFNNSPDPKALAKLENDIKHLECLKKLTSPVDSLIATNYESLPVEEKISLSRFLTEYLKEKRTRVVVGAAANVAFLNKQELLKFKENELLSIINLRSSFSALDQEIEKAKALGNSEKVKELYQIRGWSFNIAIPSITKDETAVISKLFKFGNLTCMLETKKDLISSKEMMRALISLAKALTALHARDFIYRDVALRNILVTDGVGYFLNSRNQMEKKYGFCFALTDFGFLKNLQGQQFIYQKYAKAEPIAYLAPEDIVYGLSSKASDVYSFGITMLEALLDSKDFSAYFTLKFDKPEAIAKNESFPVKRFLYHCQAKKVELDSGLQEVLFACLQDRFENRPLMKNVVFALENLEAKGVLLALKPSKHSVTGHL